MAAAAGIEWSRYNGACGQKYLPETMGGGGAFIDYDADGWPDILLLNGSSFDRSSEKTPHPTMALYHNNRDGTFTDVSQRSGLAICCNATGVAVGDYDNDGYDDLFISAIGHSILLHNVPDGTGGRKFVNVTARSGILDEGWPTSAAWVDYDCDGKLDLFVCHYLNWSAALNQYCGGRLREYCGPRIYGGQSCRLYHNDGDHFTDVTQRAGIFNRNSKALGVCIADLNDDGWPDIIVTNDTQANSLYINNEHGGFDEVAVQTGIGVSPQGYGRAGMGVDAADYLHNGKTALAIGNFSMEGLAFYELENVPPLLATERSQHAGLYAPTYRFLSFGLFFADFDNDGWPDLFVTNGHIESDIHRIRPQETFEQPNLVFRNEHNGKFSDVTAAAGNAVTQTMVGRAACRGDYDNDGRMDVLLVPNSGTPRLLHNESSLAYHWISLHLIGTRCNRDAYGAKVTIMAGGLRQTAYLSSGSSYESASDSRLHFGIGNALNVDSITIKWPGGEAESWPVQAADRIITIKQGSSPRVE